MMFHKAAVILALLLGGLLIGFAIAQSVDPAGRASIVGIFVKVPTGFAPLDFTPETFNLGTLEEGALKNYTLLISNPNGEALNMTWVFQVNGTVPIEITLESLVDGTPFELQHFLPIGAGQTLSFTVHVRSLICDSCPAGELPFLAELLFSAIAGPPPTGTPGTDEPPIQILSVETQGDQGLITYNATYRNVSSASQEIDVIVRREARNTPPDGEPLDFRASRLTLGLGLEEVISGEFIVRGLAGNAYQLRFEALSLPPGRQFAESVRVNVVMQGDPALGESASGPIDGAIESVPLVEIQYNNPLLFPVGLLSGITIVGLAVWLWGRRHK